MNHKYTILVVDDHPLMRKGLLQLLSLDTDFEIIGETNNGADALDLVREREPDLVLLDLNMKIMSGLDTLKALREEQCTSKVAILTVSDDKQDVVKLINAGADGYLLKDSEPETLLTNIKLIAQGKQVLSDSIIQYLDCLQDGDLIQQMLDSLTRRELQILQEIAKGKSNREVAEALHISEGTVKVHVKSLLKKLNSKSRVEIAIIYLEHGQ